MFNITSIWIVIGIILLLSEFLIPGFTIFFFGIGGLVTALLLIIIPPLTTIVWLQILIFLITSIVLLVLLRRHFTNTLKGDLYKEREDYIGKRCKVIELVSKDKPGRILFQGTTWTAYSTEGKIHKNQTAEILGKKLGEPMIFIIKK